VEVSGLWFKDYYFCGEKKHVEGWATGRFSEGLTSVESGGV
jgi:hypothetical protein